MTPPLLCRLHLHRFVDFPDPNPETYGQREAQGYRACVHCPATKDSKLYLPRRATLSHRNWWQA